MALTTESLLEFFEGHGLERDELDEQTPLFSSGLVDSFVMVEVMALIEKETGKPVGAQDVSLDTMDTVEKILALAASRSS